MLQLQLATELGVALPENAQSHEVNYLNYNIDAEEDALLLWLAAQIADLLQYRTEFLFNIFYCMDISEEKMHDALLPNAPEAADIGLARLMLARQKERNRTKALYPPKPIDDEGLKW